MRKHNRGRRNTPSMNTAPAIITNAKRFDSFVGQSTGRGTSRDKLERLNPQSRSFTPNAIREWYRSNGFIQNIIDAPAEDAIKNWIEITTNRDGDNESGEGLNISRLIINRLDDLGIRQKISELIRYSRMYEEGGFMYMGVLSKTPQTDDKLCEPMPAIDKIDFVNVFGPDSVTVSREQFYRSKLSKSYHKRKYSIDGVEVHESRLFHLVRKYVPEDEKGISVISTILEAILGQDTALWSISTLMYEMAVWVWKSPEFEGMSPATFAETLTAAKAVMSTQAFMGIGPNDEMQRIVGTEAGKGFIKEAVDVIFENLAGVAGLPKSRLMGQSQGVITAGQFDLRGYYESVERLQEQDIRPILYTLVNHIIHERQGAVYEALKGEVSSLDWEIKFNPIWVEDPKEISERNLKDAQTDQIYIGSGVVSPSEIKQLRFADLEEFDTWEDQPLDLQTPDLDLEDEPKSDEKKDEKENK